MIPKTFRLTNRKYTVERMSPEISEELKKHGDCDRVTGVIRLEKTNCLESLEHTFFHELVHAMLWGTTKPELSDKEDFVDSLAAQLHQYMQTHKGDFK